MRKMLISGLFEVFYEEKNLCCVMQHKFCLIGSAYSFLR
ncbi:hypothetical protein UNSWCD_63 [Campylobacter concisus UNSWCD]|nr:hypothetical protein UNSWCD_63 [Campylobacter concisus UNSWCD]